MGNVDDLLSEDTTKLYSEAQNITDKLQEKVHFLLTELVLRGLEVYYNLADPSDTSMLKAPRGVTGVHLAELKACLVRSLKLTTVAVKKSLFRVSMCEEVIKIRRDGSSGWTRVWGTLHEVMGIHSKFNLYPCIVMLEGMSHECHFDPTKQALRVLPADEDDTESASFMDDSPRADRSKPRLVMQTLEKLSIFEGRHGAEQRKNAIFQNTQRLSDDDSASQKRITPRGILDVLAVAFDSSSRDLSGPKLLKFAIASMTNTSSQGMDADTLKKRRTVGIRLYHDQSAGAVLYKPLSSRDPNMEERVAAPFELHLFDRRENNEANPGKKLFLSIRATFSSVITHTEITKVFDNLLVEPIDMVKYVPGPIRGLGIIKVNGRSAYTFPLSPDDGCCGPFSLLRFHKMEQILDHTRLKAAKMNIVDNRFHHLSVEVDIQTLSINLNGQMDRLLLPVQIDRVEENFSWADLLNHGSVRYLSMYQMASAWTVSAPPPTWDEPLEYRKACVLDEDLLGCSRVPLKLNGHPCRGHYHSRQRMSSAVPDDPACKTSHYHVARDTCDGTENPSDIMLNPHYNHSVGYIVPFTFGGAGLRADEDSFVVAREWMRGIEAYHDVVEIYGRDLPESATLIKDKELLTRTANTHYVNNKDRLNEVRPDRIQKDGLARGFVKRGDYLVCHLVTGLSAGAGHNKASRTQTLVPYVAKATCFVRSARVLREAGKELYEFTFRTARVLMPGSKAGTDMNKFTLCEKEEDRACALSTFGQTVIAHMHPSCVITRGCPMLVGDSFLTLLSLSHGINRGIVAHCQSGETGAFLRRRNYTSSELFRRLREAPSCSDKNETQFYSDDTGVWLGSGTVLLAHVVNTLKHDPNKTASTKHHWAQPERGAGQELMLRYNQAGAGLSTEEPYSTESMAGVARHEMTLCVEHGVTSCRCETSVCATPPPNVFRTSAHFDRIVWSMACQGIDAKVSGVRPLPGFGGGTASDPPKKMPPSWTKPMSQSNIKDELSASYQARRRGVTDPVAFVMHQDGVHVEIRGRGYQAIGAALAHVGATLGERFIPDGDPLRGHYKMLTPGAARTQWVLEVVLSELRQIELEDAPEEARGNQEVFAGLATGARRAVVNLCRVWTRDFMPSLRAHLIFDEQDTKSPWSNISTTGCPVPLFFIRPEEEATKPSARYRTWVQQHFEYHHLRHAFENLPCDLDPKKIEDDDNVRVVSAPLNNKDPFLTTDLFITRDGLRLVNSRIIVAPNPRKLNLLHPLERRLTLMFKIEKTDRSRLTLAHIGDEFDLSLDSKILGSAALRDIEDVFPRNLCRRGLFAEARARGPSVQKVREYVASEVRRSRAVCDGCSACVRSADTFMEELADPETLDINKVLENAGVAIRAPPLRGLLKLRRHDEKTRLVLGTNERESPEEKGSEAAKRVFREGRGDLIRSLEGCLSSIS